MVQFLNNLRQGR